MMRSLGTLFSPAFKDAQGYVFQLPAVPELGVADGFDFFLQDRSGQGHDRLMQVMNEFLAKANADPRLRQVRHNGMPDAPMVQLNVDYEKARSWGCQSRKSIRRSMPPSVRPTSMTLWIRGV